MIITIITRIFKDRLLYPSVDFNIINDRYDSIELFRTDNFYKNIRSNLKFIFDLDKILRNMSLSIIYPYDLYSSFLS